MAKHRSDPLLRKPYEYVERDDRLHMPHGISLPRVGGGNKTFVALRQYARTQPKQRRVVQDTNRATLTVIHARMFSQKRVLNRLRTRIKAMLRKADPTRDWPDDVLNTAYQTVEACGTN